MGGARGIGIGELPRPGLVLAHAGAPAVFALAPAAVVLADACAPAVLASAPHSVVLADDLLAGGLIASAPHSASVSTDDNDNWILVTERQRAKS